jgi:hypothetical protein
MAATSARRWALLPVSLIAMMAAYDEFPTATLRGGPQGRLWQCLECQRVEWTRLRKPRCAGTPEYPHPRRVAQPIAEDAGLGPSDHRRLFR